MECSEERRRLTRLPFAVEVRLQAGDRPVSGSTRNICMTGLMVTAPETLPLGTVCGVEVVLTSGLEEVPICGRGEVVRHVQDADSGEPGMGIRFLELDDVSQERLWQVVRYNTPQATEGCELGEGA